MSTRSPKYPLARLSPAKDDIPSSPSPSPSDKDRIANDLKRGQETAKQAKAAIDAGAGKIRNLEEALEDERTACTEGERKLADLGVAVAKLGERTAHADTLRTLLDELRRSRKRKELNMRTIFLDLETTGLDLVRDEILEIGILDDGGEPLIDSLVRPERHTTWPEAERINGIDPAAVADAPPLAALRPHIIKAVAGARVVIYNASFDTAFLGPALLSGTAEVVCAMRAFARVFGTWDDRHGTWRWQRLGKAAAHVGYVWPGNAHRAIHDCMATRAVWHWTNAQAVPIQTASVAPRAHRPER